LKGTDGQNEKDLPLVAIAHMSALVAVCVRYGASMRVPACQAPCTLYRDRRPFTLFPTTRVSWFTGVSLTFTWHILLMR